MYYNIVIMTSLVQLVSFLEVILMMQVNVLEAKTELSKLMRLLETQREDVITIARNGKPVVEMKAIQSPPVTKRIGAAKGKFTVPDNFDDDNEMIAEMLTGGTI